MCVYRYIILYSIHILYTIYIQIKHFFIINIAILFSRLLFLLYFFIIKNSAWVRLLCNTPHTFEQYTSSRALYYTTLTIAAECSVIFLRRRTEFPKMCSKHLHKKAAELVLDFESSFFCFSVDYLSPHCPRGCKGVRCFNAGGDFWPHSPHSDHQVSR